MKFPSKFPVSSDWFRASGVRQSGANCLVPILYERVLSQMFERAILLQTCLG